MVIPREVLTLNKEDFNALNIQQQVDLVNSYLIKGKSMIDIFKRERIIESNESSVRKKFAKNGFKHNREKKQYIQTTNEIPKPKEYSQKDIIKEQYSKGTTAVIPLKNNLQNTSKVVPSKEYPHSNTLVVSADKTETFLKLVEQQPELEELLKWWRNEKNIIDIPEIVLNKTEFTGEIMAKTFKTYRDVIDKFLEFCDKHGEYTQRDLVAMALLEYIQKYK